MTSCANQSTLECVQADRSHVSSQIRVKSCFCKRSNGSKRQSEQPLLLLLLLRAMTRTTTRKTVTRMCMYRCLLFAACTFVLVESNNNGTGAPTGLRATYMAKFQLFVDGCNSPPPVVQAACGGDIIRLINVSHPAIVCSETPEQELHDDFHSGLTCQTDCTTQDCAEEIYRNDGSYTIMEGPWGEILYQCDGISRREIDSVFTYLENPQNATCDWRFFLDNQIYRLAQLGVLCDLDAESYDEVSFLNQQEIFMEDNSTVLTYTIPQFTLFMFSSQFFECNQDNVMALDFFDQPYYSPVLCSKGENCQGDDCQVSLADPVRVHSDVYRMPGRCIEWLGGRVEPPLPPEPIVEPGTYSMNFSVGFGILMKNPYYWYDIHDLECVQDEDITLQFVCTNGVLEFGKASHPTIDCNKPHNHFLQCSVPSSGELLFGEEDFLNAFYSVQYVSEKVAMPFKGQYTTHPFT